MPEVQPRGDLVPQRQVEIRRPSPARRDEALGIEVGPGYFYDVVWVRPALAARGTVLCDPGGRQWTVAEVHGTRDMPAPRCDLRRAAEAR